MVISHYFMILRSEVPIHRRLVQAANHAVMDLHAVAYIIGQVSWIGRILAGEGDVSNIQSGSAQIEVVAPFNRIGACVSLAQFSTLASARAAACMKEVRVINNDSRPGEPIVDYLRWVLP